MGFELHPPSFGIGFGAGAFTAAVALRAWRWWQERRAAQETAQQQERELNRGIKLRPYAVRGGDRRYLNNLTRAAQTSHLAGKHVELTDILVEPRFLPLERLVQSADVDEDEPSIFEIVPRIHDFPALHAPYNLPTLGIEDLGRGDRAVAILGEMGSGRTTALMATALWSMGKLDFAIPSDVVQRKIDAEESKLDAKERAKRIKRNLEAAERARERLAALREGRKADDYGAGEETLPMLRQYVPIYVNLNNILLKSGTLDPAEPLVRAVQRQIRWYAARSTPRKLYRYLNTQKALVLLDGMDEVPVAEQPQKWAWLKAFMQQYGENFVMLALPTNGYHQAVQLGFTPVYMRPWSDVDISNGVNAWAKEWRTIGKAAEAPSETLLERQKLENRATRPFDLTLRLWAECSGIANQNQSAWVQHYLQTELPKADEWLPQLQRMAALQLNEGYITVNRLIELEMAQPLGKTKPIVAPLVTETTAAEFDSVVEAGEEGEEDEDFESFLREGETTPEPETSATPPAEDKEVTRQRRQISREQSRIISMLEKAGLLVRYRSNRYQFRHALVTSYLGALSLKTASEDVLVDKTRLSAWREALCYAHQHRDMEAAIRAKLEAPHDVLLTQLLELTRWLGFAGKKPAWRGKLLQYLGNLFTVAHQYSLVRERIAAALVSSGAEGVAMIFRRAIQHDNPEVRLLCCLALGALRDEDSVETLKGIMRRDEEEDPIQIVAAMALAAIGSEEALLTLVDEMQIAPLQSVRRAIAEMLAGTPEQGYPTLYDAVNTAGDDNDLIKLRRAAVFGLGRVRTNWSLVVLNEVLLNPTEQDYVQLGAQLVLENLYWESKRGVYFYPAIPNVPWLRDWYDQQGKVMEVPKTISSGEPLLMYALEQNIDAEARRLAVITAGQLGVIGAARKIYEALADHQEAIRDVAYRSLGQLQAYMGKTLPAPQ